MMLEQIAYIIISQIIGTLFAAAAVYAAMRADLSQLNARVRLAEEAAARAHTRIDSIVDRK